MGEVSKRISELEAEVARLKESREHWRNVAMREDEIALEHRALLAQAAAALDLILNVPQCVEIKDGSELDFQGIAEKALTALKAAGFGKAGGE